MSDSENYVINEAKPLVSVIVPIYKVEIYLDRCIQSIINQTYHNIEIFLVDDGSPDKCGDICDNYAAKYTNIHVIHQKNAGQAAARNRAVKLAMGEFITFVDSDDFIEPDYIEYLLHLQKKYQADISTGGNSYYYERIDKIKKQKRDERDFALDGVNALIQMNYLRGVGAVPWAKLYRKEILLNYSFPEGQVYEDLAVMYKMFYDCKTIAIGNRPIYNWVQRDGSTMRTRFDEKQMAAMIAVNDQISFLEKRGSSALQSAKYRHTAKAVELIAVCFNSGGDRRVFNRLKKQMNVYANETLLDNNAKLSMKLRVVAVKLGYLPAKIVFFAHESLKKHLA